MTENAFSLCMREVDVAKLVELKEWLWYEKLLLC